MEAGTGVRGDIVIASEKKELLLALIHNYLETRQRVNRTYRLHSIDYAYAKGQLQGACMAFELEIAEHEEYIIIFTHQKKEVVRVNC